jgi:hypothetical protein
LDPWNTNRYAFAGGNPITGVGFDGHCPMAGVGGGCDTNVDYEGTVQPTTTDPVQVSTRVDQHINESLGLPADASPERRAIRTSQLGVTPGLLG